MPNREIPSVIIIREYVDDAEVLVRGARGVHVYRRSNVERHCEDGTRASIEIRVERSEREREREERKV